MFCLYNPSFIWTIFLSSYHSHNTSWIYLHTYVDYGSEQIICAAFRFLASGSFLSNIADVEHVSKATICHCVTQARDNAVYVILANMIMIGDLHQKIAPVNKPDHSADAWDGKAPRKANLLQSLPIVQSHLVSNKDSIPIFLFIIFISCKYNCKTTPNNVC